VDSVSDFGKRIRLRRFFESASHKVLAVAFDHGLVLIPITGPADLAGQVDKIGASGVDAIPLNLGTLPRYVKALTQPHSPSLIIDWIARVLGLRLQMEAACVVSCSRNRRKC
jgi:DhnA family fructose-bisphosphate aldolase class Ia